MRFKTFPEFAKELERSFSMHEYCYDCVEFYHGCNAWPANKAFECADYNRLPDAMLGGGGQVFPPSRMQDRKEPNARGAPIADIGEPWSLRVYANQCLNLRRQGKTTIR